MAAPDLSVGIRVAVARNSWKVFSLRPPLRMKLSPLRSTLSILIPIPPPGSPLKKKLSIGICRVSLVQVSSRVAVTLR